MFLRHFKLKLLLLLYLTSAFSVHASICDTLLNRFNWPVGEALRDFPSSSIRPDNPTSNDYRAKIKAGNVFEIIQGAPRVTEEIPESFFPTRESYLRRSDEGLWMLQDGSSMPASVVVRLEALYQAAISRLGEKPTRTEFALRKGRAFATEFHTDSGWPTYVLVDSWNGEKTYVQGLEGNIFQVQDNEAVLLKTGENGALHAAPDPARFPNSNRIFLRMEFSFERNPFNDLYPWGSELQLY